MIIAVDPGLTIGLAGWDHETEELYVSQKDDKYEAQHWLDIVMSRNTITHFLVEDYQSAGALTKEARTTIELVGWFNSFAWNAWGFTPQNPSPQKRLSSVEKAKYLIMEDTLKSMHRDGRDAVAALAHALSFARETYGSDV